MMRKLRQLDVKRTVVSALFLPLVVFSFFSAGTMPVFSKQGFEIVICSGTTQRTILVDHDGQPIEETAQHPCEWSIQLHEAAAPATSGPVLLLADNGNDVPFREKPTALRHEVSPNINARAPPRFL